MGTQHSLNYENFFSLHLDLLCILDKETRFVKLNEAWCNLLGYTIKELEHIALKDFLHPEDISKSLNVIINLKSDNKKAFNKVNRLIDKWGNIHYLEWHCQLVEDLIYCAVKDITAFSLQEQEYQKEQQRLKALVESQSNYLIRMNLDLEYTYANPKFIETFKYFYNTEHFIGLPVFATDIENYEDTMKHSIFEAIQRPGESFQVEETVPSRDGGNLYILWECICFTDDHGNPWEIQCTGFDITEKKILAQIADKEKELRLIENNTPITKLWEGILLLPLVGIIDAVRVEILMKAILSSIAQTESKAFILDITSVGLLDFEAANYLIKINRAIKLMGCQCYICGISPTIAEILISLDVNLDDLNSTASMKEALELALSKINYKVISNKSN